MAGIEQQAGLNSGGIIELLKNPKSNTGPAKNSGGAGPTGETGETGGKRGTEGETGGKRGTEAESQTKPLANIMVEVPEPPEKKKSKAKKTNPVQQVDTTAIQTFLVMIFDFVAMRLGPHWKISQQEAEKISEPLERILSRIEKLAVVNENMDYVMLLSAVSMVIFPRVLVHKQITAEKRKVGMSIEGKNIGGNRGTLEQRQDKDTSDANSPSPSPVKAIIEQYAQ